MSDIRKYSNYMAMHDSLTEAKEWIPKAEHEDIRCYVSIESYEALREQRDKAIECLEGLKRWALQCDKSGVIEERVDDVLSEIGGRE